MVKSTPPISPIKNPTPKSSQIIRKPPRSPASPQTSRPLSMGPPSTPIKENGIRGRRLGSEDLEVISSTNKFKENERMQKASSSSNILDSSNGTGMFSYPNLTPICESSKKYPVTKPGNLQRRYF